MFIVFYNNINCRHLFTHCLTLLPRYSMLLIDCRGHEFEDHFVVSILPTPTVIHPSHDSSP